MYSAIHERRGSALLEQAARAAASAGGPADALLIGVDTYVRYLASHPDYLRIHLAESQPWALDPRFQSQAQRDQWRMGKELTASVFRAAMAEGTVHRQDPELAARLMIAAHQVFLADWVESGMREPLGKLSRRMQEHVKRSFFRSPLGTARRAAD